MTHWRVSWTVEDTDACYIVRDHNGQALAYVYFSRIPWDEDQRGVGGRPLHCCYNPNNQAEARAAYRPGPLGGRWRGFGALTHGGDERARWRTCGAEGFLQQPPAAAW